MQCGTSSAARAKGVCRIHSKNKRKQTNKMMDHKVKHTTPPQALHVCIIMSTSGVWGGRFLFYNNCFTERPKHSEI